MRYGNIYNLRRGCIQFASNCEAGPKIWRGLCRRDISQNNFPSWSAAKRGIATTRDAPTNRFYIIIHAMEHISLADSFSSVTEADWLALVDKIARRRLFRCAADKASRRAETTPLHGPALRSAAAQPARLEGDPTSTGNADHFNDDLANGTSAFAIDLQALAANQRGTLKYYLASDAEYHAVPGSSLASVADLIAADACALKGSAGFDPLTAAARSGELPAGKAAFWADYADAAFYIRKIGPVSSPSR